MGLTNGGYKLEWKLWNRGNNVWCHIFYQPNGFEVYLNHPNTFWISSATSKYTYWMVQKQKTKGLANWVREWEKMKGHGAVWNISLVFFFFLRIKVFFILIYWILTTLKIKRTQYMWKKKL